MPGPGMELIGEEETKELIEVIESGYLFRYGSPDNPAFKAKVYRLEQEVAVLLGLKYAVAVNSGTTALLVALSGLGVGPGDEVIVPGYTFIASMSSIIYARDSHPGGGGQNPQSRSQGRPAQDHAAHQGHPGGAYVGQPRPAGRTESHRG